MTQTMTLAEAVAVIPNGSHVGIGGVLLDRKPIAAVAALAARRPTSLTVSSFLASLDVEILLAAESIATLRTGYVGLEHRGPAPLMRAAVQEGRLTIDAHSELTFTRGLRAAAAGLPFLPLRGAVGTDLVAGLDLREVADPYGSGPVLVAPASPLDFAVIHCVEADVTGAVAVADPTTFLWDADATLAGAAATVVVTAERVVDRISGSALLTGLDVDVVVEAPGGARPLGLAGSYSPDEDWLAGYVTAADPAGVLAGLIPEASP